MAVYRQNNIPPDALAFLSTNAPNHNIAVVAFSPGGGWVVVDGDGSYAQGGIPPKCATRLQSFQTSKAKIHAIAFPPKGGWVIVTDQGHDSEGIPHDCVTMLTTFETNHLPVSCVAFPPSGGDSWIVIGPNAFYESNIDAECLQYLYNYTQNGHRVSHVAFGPDGGWVIFGETELYASGNIDPARQQEIMDLRNHGWVIGCVAFTQDAASDVPSSGGYVVAANHKKTPVTNLMRTFENQFFPDGAGGWQTIWQRMSYWGVPGTSVAYVEGKAVAWCGSYGILKQGEPDRVYPHTRFQAGSISKPPTAVGVLTMENGTPPIKITDAITNYTGSWTIPYRSCGGQPWVNGATIERALRHMSGIRGDGNTYPLTACSTGFTPKSKGGGFAGYPDTGITVPSLSEVLAGEGIGVSVNSPPINLSTPPGDYHYSGPGFVVLMQMLLTITGIDFATWIQQTVLKPVGMNDSTYELQPAPLPHRVPGNWRLAAGHYVDGTPIPGDRNRHPESAAAGLYTTARDLGRFIVMLLQKGTIDGTPVLSAAQVGNMIGQQMGIFHNNKPSTDTGFYFSHDGSNVGFTANIQGYPNQLKGVAILTNLDNATSSLSPVHGNATSFYFEVMSAIQRIYSIS